MERYISWWDYTFFLLQQFQLACFIGHLVIVLQAKYRTYFIHTFLNPLNDHFPCLLIKRLPLTPCVCVRYIWIWIRQYEGRLTIIQMGEFIKVNVKRFGFNNLHQDLYMSFSPFYQISFGDWTSLDIILS